MKWKPLKEMYNYNHLIKKLKEKDVYTFFKDLKSKKIIQFETINKSHKTPKGREELDKAI